MSPIVAASFKAEKNYQLENKLHCLSSVDGYNNFIFISQNGKPRINVDVDAVIRRMVASYNKYVTMNTYTDFFPEVKSQNIVLIDRFLSTDFTPKLTPIDSSIT